MATTKVNKFGAFEIGENELSKLLDEPTKEKQPKPKEVKKSVKIVPPPTKIDIGAKKHEDKSTLSAKQGKEVKKPGNVPRNLELADLADDEGKWETHVNNMRERVFNVGHGGRNNARKEPQSDNVKRVGEVQATRGVGMTRASRGTGHGGVNNRPFRSNGDDTTQDTNKDANRAYGRGMVARRGGMIGDRHSGSDKTRIKPIPKKDGHGAGNWGDIKDELEGETEQIPKVDAEPTPKAEETGDTEHSKDDAKTVTYSEFKAHATKKEETHFNIRKAGEGQDIKVYKHLVPLKKDELNEEKQEFEVIVKQKPVKDVSHLLGFIVEGASRETHRGNALAGAQRSTLIALDEFPVLNKA